MSSKVSRRELDLAIASARASIQQKVQASVLTQVAVLEGPFATRIDDSSVPVVYSGEAESGAAESDHVWRIKRIDVSVGAVVTWADGNTNFDNAWSDRTSLSYS